MDPLTRKLMMLLAFSIAVVYSVSLANAESELVHEFCNETDDYQSCVAALRLYPQAAKATTLVSFGEIILRGAARDAGRSRKHVERMLADPNIRSSWKPVLETCKAHLQNAARQFSVASRELMMDITSANYDVSMASVEIEKCLAFMRSSKQNIPSLITRCAHAKTLVSIGLVVTLE